jgi:hypothetical protein
MSIKVFPLSPTTLGSDMERRQGRGYWSVFLGRLKVQQKLPAISHRRRWLPQIDGTWLFCPPSDRGRGHGPLNIRVKGWDAREVFHGNKHVSEP